MGEVDPALDEQDHSPFRWFLTGVRLAATTPAFILAASFVGFSGLAREAGLDVYQTAFMTIAVWALPSQIVLVGAILAGHGLVQSALAVALSALRLLPMTVAILPELKGPDTRKSTLYFLSHFVAVTGWVLGMNHLKSAPRSMRTAMFAGIGSTLLLTNVVIIALVYLLSTTLPSLVFALLMFMIPVYFLTSLWQTAIGVDGVLALVFGLVLGPLFHLMFPQYDLMLAGLVGGSGAFWIGRQRRLKG